MQTENVTSETSDAANSSVSVPPNSGERNKERAYRCPAYRELTVTQELNIVGAFPALTVLPDDPEKRRQLKDRFDILHGEMTRYFVCMDRLNAAAGQGREAELVALRQYFAERTFRMTDDPVEIAADRENLHRSISAAHALVSKLVDSYFSRRKQQTLKMSSPISSEHDPINLLRMCRRNGRTDLQSRIDAFEARRALSLAEIEFKRHRKGIAKEQLEAVYNECCAHLKRDFFLPERSRRMVLIGDLDEQGIRVVGKPQLLPNDHPEAQAHATARRQKIELDIQFIRVPDKDGGTREIPVFFDGRVKDDVIPKLMLKGTKYPETLTDLIGVMLVFFSEEDESDGVAHLRRTFANTLGSVSGSTSRVGREGAMDSQNMDSSPLFYCDKYILEFFGSKVEIMFKPAIGYMNEIVARDEENHSLYKVRRYMNHVFPLMFPFEIYGIDWRDKDVREDLWDLQIAMI